MSSIQNHRVLNLGAGVQSTALYLMAIENFNGFSIDCAVFADTQNEPQKVYDHLNWLISLKGPPILIRSAGNIVEEFNRRNYISIPFFIKKGSAKKPGKARRSCSRLFKMEVIYTTIRIDVLKLPPRKHVPKHVTVSSVFGISLDEAQRATRIIRNNKWKWVRPEFPLIDMGMTRKDIIEWLTPRVPHPVPKSACIICPLRSSKDWAVMKATSPDEFRQACEFDKFIRHHHKGFEAYLHYSGIPLDLVEFDALPPQQLDGFSIRDCTGACGV